MATNIFATEVSEDVQETIRRTMNVSLSEAGEPIVSFATNRGKGTGATAMPASDFAEFGSTLEHFSSNGIEEDIVEDLSPAEMVRSTIQHNEGVISFRVRGGKGAKPAKIPSGDFSEVVELLRSTVDAVLHASERLSK